MPGSASTDEAKPSPGGYYIYNSATMTVCGVNGATGEEIGGAYCPVGSNTQSTTAAGEVSDEVGLFFAKPCPPGYICSGTAGEAPVAAAAGEYGAGGQGTAGATATGYWSDALGTGQYETACKSGTYTDVAGATECTDCADGSYCFGGEQPDCPKGFYCVTALT